MHLFKLDNGIYIDEKEICGVTGIALKSEVGDLSEVTLTFLCTIDGLNNIKDKDKPEGENMTINLTVGTIEFDPTIQREMTCAEDGIRMGAV